MKIAIAMTAVLALGLAMPSTDFNAVEWENYKKAHGKSYESDEMEAVRKSIYFQNKDKVVAHNDRFDQGLVSYSLKLNHFADQLPEELAVRRGIKSNVASSGDQAYQPSNDALPASVDWRDSGAVTPVKDQGQCGSCWAFSITGTLEGQWFIQKGSLVSLSEQELVDCSTATGNFGCGGGLGCFAYDYIRKSGGIDTESSYGYSGTDGTCAFNKSNVAASITGYVVLTQYSESELQNAVATIGPIAINIDASSEDFQLYDSGVYDQPSCSSTWTDHSVLAVGYGTDNDGTEYWLVKNSWGASWGESGYIRMSRNKNNQCSIATCASYPLL